MNSFQNHIERKILYQVKVAGSCISQLYALLSEISNEQPIISVKQIKTLITNWANDLKRKFNDFMEITKNQITHMEELNDLPSSTESSVYSSMKSAMDPIVDLVRVIISNILFLEEQLDASTLPPDGKPFSPSDKHITRANAIINSALASSTPITSSSAEKHPALDLPGSFFFFPLFIF